MQAEAGSEQHRLMHRRSFLNYCLGASIVTFGGFSAYAFGKYLLPPGGFDAQAEGETMRISLAELPVGGAKVLRYRGEPSIVVRVGERSVRALSAVCTHLGCIVKWDSSREALLCPCHAAIFDVNGNVVSGPAPRPLASHPIRIAQDEIIIGEV